MRRLFAGLRPPPGYTDRHLLDRFRADRDEAAFAELVRRHGPLVWGVCRRTLAPPDAEDAFQATFLLLLRRPPAGESLAPWLYRVAVLVARTARRAERRRLARVRVGLPAAEPAAPVRDDDSRDAVDAALMGLSARDRAAVVLCHLEGHTRAEAARRLGVPEGTLSARLSRALAKLRLGRDPAAVLAVAGAGLVPAGLEAAAVRAGVLYLAGGAVPPAVATITRGVLTMSLWKTATAVGLVLVGLAGTGVGVGLRAGPPDKPAGGVDRKLIDELDAARAEYDTIRQSLQETAAVAAKQQQSLQSVHERIYKLRNELFGPMNGMLVVTDHMAPNGSTFRYQLAEPTQNGQLDYTARDLKAFAVLFARARAARPDAALWVHILSFGAEPRRLPAEVGDLLGAIREAGATELRYSGPDLPAVRPLATAPSVVVRVPVAGDPSQHYDEFVATLDLTKLK